MHVISRKKLLEAAERHRDLAGPLDVWYRIAKKADWRSLTDVRRRVSHSRRGWAIYNIQHKGKCLPAIVEINYRTRRFFCVTC